MGDLSIQGNAVELSRIKHNLGPEWFDLSRNRAPAFFHPSFSKTCKRVERSMQTSSFDSKPAVHVLFVTSSTTFLSVARVGKTPMNRLMRVAVYGKPLHVRRAIPILSKGAR